MNAHRRGRRHGARRGANCWLSCASARKASVGAESSQYEEEIRQRCLKPVAAVPTALFVIVFDTVHVIHVRGPGQNLMPPDELRLP